MKWSQNPLVGKYEAPDFCALIDETSLIRRYNTTEEGSPKGFSFLHFLFLVVTMRERGGGGLCRRYIVTHPRVPTEILRRLKMLSVSVALMKGLFSFMRGTQTGTSMRIAPHHFAKCLPRPLSDAVEVISDFHLKNASDLIRRLQNSRYEHFFFLQYLM